MNDMTPAEERLAAVVRAAEVGYRANDELSDTTGSLYYDGAMDAYNHILAVAYCGATS